jgi:hypothetical protein
MKKILIIKIIILFGIFPLKAQIKHRISGNMRIATSGVFYVSTGDTVYFNNNVITARDLSESKRGVISFAETTGWEESGYVNGYVRSYKTDRFVFPIGEDVYRPAAISAAAIAAPTDAAYYAEALYDTASLGDMRAITNESWVIQGTTIANITLSWSSDIAVFAGNKIDNIFVVGWDTITKKWEKIPSTIDTVSIFGTAPSFDSGSVTTSIALVPNTYSAYTLGTEKRWIVAGTVFPFVYYEPTGNPEEDELIEYMNTAFSVTAQLFEVPPVGVADPFEELLTYTPLFTGIAETYEKAMWRPGIPKDPGMIGKTNNPGVSIHWEDLIENPISNIDSTELGENELPDNPVGVFTFTGVLPGNYILVLSRVGYVTRYAEVEVIRNGDYLKHRELVLGDVNNDGEITYNDVTAALSNYSSLFDPSSDPAYDPRYDINADGMVDCSDIISIVGLQGFWFYNYSDTRLWLNKYFGK